MKNISLIGCGRWGTFLAWYAANYCKDKISGADLYDIPTSPNFIELRDTRKNPYLRLSDNMILHDNILLIYFSKIDWLKERSALTLSSRRTKNDML